MFNYKKKREAFSYTNKMDHNEVGVFAKPNQPERKNIIQNKLAVIAAYALFRKSQNKHLESFCTLPHHCLDPIASPLVLVF